MNILEDPFKIDARTSKLNKKMSIIYSVAEQYHSLCIDKKEIMRAQIKACERLSDSTLDKRETLAIQNEIAELKLALEILNY